MMREKTSPQASQTSTYVLSLNPGAERVSYRWLESLQTASTALLRQQRPRIKTASTLISLGTVLEPLMEKGLEYPYVVPWDSMSKFDPNFSMIIRTGDMNMTITNGIGEIASVAVALLLVQQDTILLDITSSTCFMVTHEASRHSTRAIQQSFRFKVDILRR